MEQVVTDCLHIIRKEYETFLTYPRHMLDEYAYQWIYKCSGDVDPTISEYHIQSIYKENPSITPIAHPPFQSMKEVYAMAKELDHWTFLPIYMNGERLFPMLFRNTYTCVTDKTYMMGFMVLRPGMIVPWHNHTNHATKITHYNLYNLENPAFFYTSATMPYTDTYAHITTQYVQYEKDWVTFHTSMYHKTENKNPTNRISFVIEELL